MNWRDWQALQRVMELGERYLSYVDLGAGPPVVLLHGIPTWGYVWCGLAQALARTHRVLVPDLLGFGFSDKRDGFDRSITRQAEALDAWLGRLGVADAVVVGHDLGGGVAQQLAFRFPTRVGRVCLMNSVSYDSWPMEVLLQLGHPSAARKLSARLEQRMLRMAVRRGLFARPPPTGLVEGLLAPYSTEVGKKSLVRDAVALNTNQTMELAPKLKYLAVPVLLVWGVDDILQPVRYGERLAWDIPGAKLVRVEGAKHFVMWDAPNEVAEALFTFLGGARPEAVPVAGAAPLV